MWLVIVAVLSLGLGILALVGLLALARELIFERPFEANFDDEGAKGKCDGVGATMSDDAMSKTR